MYELIKLLADYWLCMEQLRIIHHELCPGTMAPQQVKLIQAPDSPSHLVPKHAFSDDEDASKAGAFTFDTPKLASQADYVQPGSPLISTIPAPSVKGVRRGRLCGRSVAETYIGASCGEQPHPALAAFQVVQHPPKVVGAPSPDCSYQVMRPHWSASQHDCRLVSHTHIYACISSSLGR